MNIRYLLISIFAILMGAFSYAQETIEETKEIADKFFEKEQYVEATPYYLRLLALEPRNHNFNFRYGTCLLYNPGKNQDPFKYLNYSVTSPTVEIEANYFMGKAFHLNYQFNDAVKYYKIYQQKAGANASEKLDVARQIEMCENGKRLITTITEMIVLDKKEIEKDKFFRIYDLSDIGGNLLVTAEFQTKLDEKRNHIPLIHFPANPTVIYYSSYGTTGKTGKDIYVQRRLPTGGWGVPALLQGDVNTKFDEDYPYMHPDGNYLYFSSKGHNSMGGYDVFRCKYDAETDMFGKAENMDFAVSSPNDDLFYVVDSLNKNAYFGSNRQTADGKLNVYKVLVDRVPLNMSVIKGEFSSLINPQQKKVFIDVKDYASGEFIGNFNSNEKGVYLITFPKGGKYEFTIRVGDNPQEYKYLASIPFLKEFKPLKQKIIHEMDGDRENVKVIDLFNEEVEDPQAVFAQVVRQKSVLDPNADKFDLDALDRDRREKEVLKELGVGNLSLVEVGYLLEEEVKDAQKAERGTVDLENKLHAQVFSNAAEIERLDKIIQAKIAQAATLDSDRKKYKLLKEVERYLKIQDELKTNSLESMRFADSLSRLPKSGSAAATAEIQKLSAEYNALMKENKQKEAFAYLYANKDKLKKIIDEKTPDPLQTLVERSLVLDDEISRLQPKDDEYVRELKRLDQELTTLELSKNGASKKELAEIEANIKSKKNERTMVEEEREFNGTGLKRTVAERSALRKQIDALEAVYSIKSDKIVTEEELAKAMSTTNGVDPKGTRSEISGQIAALVLKSPEVKEVDYADMESELGSVMTNSRSQSDRIKSDASLTPAEKANKLKALDRELLTSLNNEIQTAKNALKNNPNDAEMKKRLDGLQTAKSLVSAALDLPDGDEGEILASNGGNTAANAKTSNAGASNAGANNGGANNGGANDGAANNTDAANNGTASGVANTAITSADKQSAVQGVSADYSDKVAQINANSNLSETEKLTQLQQADQALQTALAKEIATVEAALKNNPSDAALTRKLEALKAAKSDLDSAIADREIKIAGSDIANQEMTTADREKWVEEVSPGYNETVANVNSNNALSTADRLTQLQNADKSLLAELEKQITKTENDSKKNPGDQALLKKIGDLKTIRTQLESAIAERENAIASSTASLTKPLSTQEKESLIEAITPTYNEEIAQINSNSALTEQEKLMQLQLKDKALISAISQQLSAAESALKNNPSDAALSKKVADLKTLKADVEAKVAAREAVIASSSQPLSEKAKSDMIDALSPVYAAKTKTINNNSALSVDEKAEQLQAADRELLGLVKKEIAALENNIQNNPDPSLSKELADYKTIQADLEATIAQRDAQAGGTSNLTAQQKEQLIESVSKSYNEDFAKINNDASLTSSEKTERLNQLDQTLISAIENELAKTQTALNANPTDAALLKKVNDLQGVKTELQTVISGRESALASNNNARSAGFSNAEKEQLIETVAASYNEQVAQIKSNGSLSETEKMKQLNQLDQTLITSLETEITKAQTAVNNNPSDATLGKKLKDLQTVKSDLQAAIASRENEIVASAGGSSDLNATEKASLIEAVNGSYNEKVEQINSNTSLSASDKLMQLNGLDKELIASLDKEISKTEAAVKKNPADAALGKKLADLKNIQTELQTTVARRDSEIAASRPALSAAEKESLIASVDEKYNEKVAEINSNGGLSDGAKLNQLNQLDRALISSLDKEIEKTEAALKKNPSDASLSKKLSDLQTVKAELQSNIASRESALAANTQTSGLSQEKKEELIASVNSSYAQKTAQINNNTSLTPAKKLTKLNQLDRELVLTVEKEIEKVEADLKKNPSDAALAERLSDLQTLKSELENGIAVRDADIADAQPALDPKAKAEIIKSINSKYDKKVTSINNDASLSVTEKLNQLQEVDYALLKEVNTELEATEAELAKNPSDSKLQKRLQELKALKTELDTDVTSRESVIASSGNGLSAKAKEELVKSVSPTYAQKVSEISSNEYMLDSEKQLELQKLDEELIVKIDKEIASLEKELSLNPDNAMAKRKLEQLKEVRADVVRQIAERKTHSSSTPDNALAAKSELIETIDSQYNEKVAAVNKNAFISQKEKLEQLQKLDQELLSSVDKSLEKATASAKRKPKDEELAKEKEELTSLKSTAEDVIAERAQMIENLDANDVSAQQKSELIAQVKPGHEARLAAINGAKSDKNLMIQDLIKEEKLLLEKLEAEASETEALLAKSPKDETLKTKMKVINASRKETETKIEELQLQAVTLKAADIDQKALVAKVDPSYASDVKAMQASSSVSKSADLASRESQFQEKIAAQVAVNEQTLASNYSLEVAAENQILNQKLKESKANEENYRAGGTSEVSANIVDPVKVQALRSELLGSNAVEVAKNYTDLNDLKKQEEILLQYSDALNTQLDKVNQQLANDPSNVAILEQKKVIQSEVNATEAKITQTAAKIDAAGGGSSDTALSSPELKRLMGEEQDLQKQLDNPSLTSKERSALEKQLVKVQTERKTEENTLMTENIAQRKTDNAAKSTQLKQLATTSEIAKTTADLAGSQNERLSKEADALVAQSVKAKDLDKKNELLTEAMAKQASADAAVQEALETNAVRAAIANQVSTLDSKEELEQKKRKFSIEIEEITGQIEDLDTEIAGMKAKKAGDLIAKRDALVEERSLLEKELDDVNKQIAAIQETPTTIDPDALAQSVSISEEQRLIASKEYLEYSINANKAVRLENEIAAAEATLTEKRQIAKELIAMSLDKSSQISDADVKASVQNVKVVEDDIAAKTMELAQRQQVAADLLASNPNDAMRMQNLLRRGVEPGFNEDLAMAEKQRAPAAGLQYSAEPLNIYSDQNPIPVDVKNPAGLVYRIQVGAFSKPIKQDMYKSFTPITGEKLSSGITRYMAGYFNNSATVDEAHTQVKDLGYADAFIVAYCDDERIPLAEARRLEQTGQCISTNSQAFVIAMANAKAGSETGKQTSTETGSYNEAPGAVKATAVETRKGLFYTVQVGVYNKPATAKQLKYIDPLVTKRLDNGQIRYSTGMFRSVEDAKPKKAEAVDKGVRDAFITAYYNGERLTLSQAAALLKEKGVGILENVDQPLVAANSPSDKPVVDAKAEEEKASAYNKAPGALPATAAETKMGLFFTVQVGVYSKPVTIKELKGMKDLVSKKLPNGQIRYSTGMYSSIEAADPRRLEVLDKGVKHAYITAYYKGERITLTEARALLQQNGDTILEPLNK